MSIINYGVFNGLHGLYGLGLWSFSGLFMGRVWGQ